MSASDIRDNLPGLRSQISSLLDKRLNSGKMVPFDVIPAKLWKWMTEHEIKVCAWYNEPLSRIQCEEWRERYVERTLPMRDGYIGIEYSGIGRPRKGLARVFYLELPIDLVEKALALGFFP